MTIEVLRVLGVGLAALFLAAILRQYSPALAAALSLGAGAVIWYLALRAGKPVFSLIRELAQRADTTGLSCLLRAAAIALLSQFAQDACRDAGQTSLAGQLEFAGKIGVLLAAAPMLTELAEILLRFLQ